jgi:hypothetical protein
MATWSRRDSVDAVIVPSGNNSVGAALAAAVLNQAGVAIKVFRHGRLGQVTGWLGGTRTIIPGLGVYRAVPAETVDPLIMPDRYGLTSRMTFRAALVSRIEQAGFEALAFLAWSGVFRNIGIFVPVLAWGREITRRWSHDRGGLCLKMSGLDENGRCIEADWSLLAQDGDGPHVPVLPLVAAVRLLLDGRLPVGARLAAGEISLAQIEAEFARLAITTQTVVTPVAASPFERVLGNDSFGKLAAPLQAFHQASGHRVWCGQARVTRGRSLVSRFIGGLIGLPGPSSCIACEVGVERHANGMEMWTRIFGETRFHSTMSANSRDVLQEQFGPVCLDLDVVRDGGALRLPVKSCRVFGVPLPTFLHPRSIAREYGDAQGRFHFDVRLELPLFGLLAHYAGWLVPKTLLHQT